MGDSEKLQQDLIKLADLILNADKIILKYLKR